MNTAEWNHACEPKAVATFMCRRCKRTTSVPMERHETVGGLVGVFYRMPSAPRGWVGVSVGHVTGIACGECAEVLAGAADRAEPTR
jgi:hypothetical protein